MKANLKQTALVLVLGAVAASAAVPAFAAEGDLDFSSMIQLGQRLGCDRRIHGHGRGQARPELRPGCQQGGRLLRSLVPAGVAWGAFGRPFCFSFPVLVRLCLPQPDQDREFQLLFAQVNHDMARYCSVRGLVCGVVSAYAFYARQ
ncbi:hypothetical protein P4G46_16165 [Pseudomonas aeruginosa]|uniref:hypothetical protein n=1 Tax=Pseudomonas aeruginosa TaxID=287 RepID=UPI00283A9DAA|nr:hypothetical protein [Pseudomonas aeruginosa]WMU88461.1 hypothetical protein P4G46_16165 [Pseudomonas aeruginosa]